MTWIVTLIDLILGLLFVAANVLYVINAFETYTDASTSLKYYQAFDDIWTYSDHGTFLKIVCSVVLGAICCVGILIMYAAKLVYLIKHRK